MSVQDERLARCRCGSLTIRCVGKPTRVSVCHCLECQRRTGSAFGAQARFPVQRVTATGPSATFERAGSGGATISYRFCPRCGSTVFYSSTDEPDQVTVPLGAFADPGFPPPTRSFFETRRHPWVELTATPIERVPGN